MSLIDDSRCVRSHRLHAGAAGLVLFALLSAINPAALSAQSLDWGDAPESYRTSLAANGPNHFSGNGLHLGSCADTEADASPPLDGSGDDATVGAQTFGACAVAGDDEDGVTIPPLVACEVAQIQLVASATMRLDAWIDWNRDGDFDDFVPFDFAERIATRLVLTPGLNTLSISVPCSAVTGPSYARFRVSSNGVLDSFGPAGEAGGEVEDYGINISRGVIAVPALGAPGLVALATLLAFGAFFVLRRRRAASD